MGTSGQSPDASKPLSIKFGKKESTFATAPTCPRELDAVGKKKWRELVKLLEEMKLITRADRDMMELYCAAYSRRKTAEAMLKKFGEVLKSKQGGLYRSPYLDVANHASKEMQKLAKGLGLDPMSRKKLGVTRFKSEGVAKRDRTVSSLPPPRQPQSPPAT
jgi:P27 family predicted phage terminase small subunit